MRTFQLILNLVGFFSDKNELKYLSVDFFFLIILFLLCIINYQHYFKERSCLWLTFYFADSEEGCLFLRGSDQECFHLCCIIYKLVRLCEYSKTMTPTCFARIDCSILTFKEKEKKSLFILNIWEQWFPHILSSNNSNHSSDLKKKCLAVIFSCR